MRTGFTLVETLVALMLLQFAMLALGAGIASSARDLAYARHLAAATTRAQNRVALLRAAPCAGSSSGSVRIGAELEDWRVERSGARRTIVDSITFPRAGGRTGVTVVRAVTWCET